MISSAAEQPGAARAATLGWWEPGLDDTGVLSLRRSVLGEDHPHGGSDFLAWMFGDENPAGRGGAVTIERGSRTLGFAGIRPRLARIEGHDATVAFGLDYMVHPAIGSASSGRYAVRLGVRWNEIAGTQDYDLAMSFPNENSRRLLTSRFLGWREVFSPRLMLRPLGGGGAESSGEGGERRLLRGLGIRTLGTALDLAGDLAAAFARGRRGKGLVRRLDLADENDSAAVDRLWTRRRDDARMRLRRDAASLRWRYVLHPIRQYEITGLEDSRGLHALVVTTLRELHGVPSVIVADALFDPSDRAGAATLIRGALRSAARAGARLSAAEARSGSDLARALRTAGFVTVPRRLDPKHFLLCAWVGSGRSGDVLSPAGWDFAWGDIDVV